MTISTGKEIQHRNVATKSPSSPSSPRLSLLSASVDDGGSVHHDSWDTATTITRGHVLQSTPTVTTTVTPAVAVSETAAINNGAKSSKRLASLSLRIPQRVSVNNAGSGDTVMSPVKESMRSSITNAVNGQSGVNQEQDRIEQKTSGQRTHAAATRNMSKALCDQSISLSSCSATQRQRASVGMKSPAAVGLLKPDNKRRPPRSPLPQLSLTTPSKTSWDGGNASVDASPYSSGASAVRIDSGNSESRGMFGSSVSRNHTSVRQNFNPWARVDSPTAADIPPTPGSPPAEPFRFPPAAAFPAGSDYKNSTADSNITRPVVQSLHRLSKQHSTDGPVRPHLSIPHHAPSEPGAPPSLMAPPRLSISPTSPMSHSPVSADRHDEPCSPATPNRKFLEQNFSQLHISTYQSWQEQSLDDSNDGDAIMQQEPGCGPRMFRRNSADQTHASTLHDMPHTEDHANRSLCVPFVSGRLNVGKRSKRRGRKHIKGVLSMTSFELYRKEDRLPHTCFTTAMQRNYVRTLPPDEQSFLMKQQKEFMELCEQVRRRSNRTLDTSGGGLSSNRLATRPIDMRNEKKQNVGKILDTCLAKRNMLISKNSKKSTHQTRKQQLMSIRAHTFFGHSNPRDASQATS